MAKNDQDDAVIDRTAQNDNWVIAKEVEEEPGEENDQENDERAWVPQEAEEEDEEYGHGVVDPEVGEVAAEAHFGFAE